MKEEIIEITDKREPVQRLVVNNSDLSQSTFTNCRVADATFHDVSLPHVKVTYADLGQCHFEDMNMVSGTITNANLTKLTIDGVNFSGVTIRNAGADEPVLFENLSIPNSTLKDCDLTNVDLTNCKIEGLRINGISIAELLADHTK